MLVGVHYSQKAYFDPAVGSVGDISHYEQWHYTRTDGVEVLLAVDENTARIYADLPHAFVSIQTNAISKKALEQLSEIFDFTIQPSSASLEEIHTLLSAAENRNDAQISQQEKALYENGYAEYVTQLMEKYADFPTGTEYMTYALKDINADGYDELIVCNFEDNLIEILTTNGNDSFHYFDASLLAASRINLYEGNVIGIFDTYEDNGVLYEFNYYFFHADPKGASFITGLHKNEDGTWDKFLEHPEPDPKAWKTESITEADARNILQSFAPIQWERKPISEYPFE